MINHSVFLFHQKEQSVVGVNISHVSGQSRPKSIRRWFFSRPAFFCFIENKKLQRHVAN